MRFVGLVVAAILGIGHTSSIVVPVTSIERAASASKGAARLDPPASTCQLIAAAIDKRHPGSTQQLVVRTVGWTDTAATVQLANLVGGKWTCGAEMIGRIGRNGYRPLLERRSNDG